MAFKKILKPYGCTAFWKFGDYEAFTCDVNLYGLNLVSKKSVKFIGYFKSLAECEKAIKSKRKTK